MEKSLEKEPKEQRSESPVSLFLSTYLRINRDSLEKLKQELNERNLSSEAIGKILGLPETMIEH